MLEEEQSVVGLAGLVGTTSTPEECHGFFYLT
jgi:hypothetical protein